MTLTSEPRKRNKYNEIMERVQVTPEMHERIMGRIRTMDIPQQTPPAKPTLWTRYRKYMVTAASLIVVLAGVLAAQHGFAPGTSTSQQQSVTGTNAPEVSKQQVPESTKAPQSSDMISPYSSTVPNNRSMAVTGTMSYTSLAELTQAVGYEVKQVNKLPFQSTQTQYSVIGKLAEIRYIGSSNDLTFRMQPGSGDISGDNGEYSNIRTVTENGASVTMKGYDKGFNLAIWEQNGYTYSIMLQQPINSEHLLEAVRSVK